MSILPAKYALSIESDFLRYLRLLFIRVSAYFYKQGRYSLRKRKLSSKVFIRAVTAVRTKRKYMRRFYRRVFKLRYSRSYKPDQIKLLQQSTRTLACVSHGTQASMKPFFHIKNIFNLNEFLMYDYYNFHKSRLNRSSGNATRRLKELTTKF